MHNVVELYKSRIETFSEQLREVKKQIAVLSYARLLSIFLIAVSLYAGFVFGNLYFFGALPLAIVFLFLIQKHSHLFRNQAILTETLRLNQSEVDFFAGDRTVFDTGSDQDVKNHLYAVDLDIFGIGSLYQTINRTVTAKGKEFLCHCLLNPLQTPADIDKRREAVTELVADVDERQKFYATGSLSQERAKDSTHIDEWMKLPDFFQGRRHFLLLAYGMSAASIGSILWMIIQSEFNFLLFILLLTVNSIILGFLRKASKVYFEQFGNRTQVFKKYSELFDLISHRSFNSDSLNQVKHDAGVASSAYIQLFRLSNLADQRLNGMVGPLMNALFLFDIWCIAKIEKWRLLHRHSHENWMNSLAMLDMLLSFSNFSFNHPDYCQATIETDGLQIIARQMGHPLITHRTSVKNDYEIGVTAGAHIITGSNMAGKSTFIRSVGLNVVLALNGLPVCAERFKTSILYIAACIRLTDSLEENTSYFKAELVRLQQVMNVLNGKIPALVLLDEILRGTNSIDKHQGTLAFFRRFMDYDCLALLATHDLAIGQLQTEHPAEFENFCFESSVVDGHLNFDYRLRPGVSKSTNATFLMRDLGLIE